MIRTNIDESTNGGKDTTTKALAADLSARATIQQNHPTTASHYCLADKNEVLITP